jgi:urease accessory protein
MIRATTVVSAAEMEKISAIDSVTLDFDDRYRRRIALQADGGLTFLLDLPAAQPIRHGEGLRLEDGSVIRVLGRPERLVAVAAPDALTLARLAWHLGNRHLPAQFEQGRVLIRDDHVIVDMLRGLGAQIEIVSEPFQPEGGAYGQHNHDHGHPHDHHHDHHHPHDGHHHHHHD